MQVPLADGQSKIIGTRNKGIQKKQEILLLEFCKNTRKQKRGQREQTMSTILTQQSTCFCLNGIAIVRESEDTLD